ncbi:aminodeoxychorismate synthase component I [Planctomycetota bacterium]|nr:aminodeoxychorismate synthase component I [Planctomycetota bacterium]
MAQFSLQSQKINLPYGWQGVIAAFAQQPYAVIFDSALAGELGRLSHASFGPIELLRASVRDDESPLTQFGNLIKTSEIGVSRDGFYGGWAGLLGYDLRCCIEAVPLPKAAGSGFPDLQAGFYPWALTFDHATEEATITLLNGKGLAAESISELATRVSALLHEPPKHSECSLSGPKLSTNKAAYLKSAQTVLRHIYEGDIYQANLTREVVHQGETDPIQIYTALRKHNPAPFGGFLDCGDGRIVLSSSPECFLSVRDGKIETRPIKGTRARDADPIVDARVKEELANAEKDRAELTMIVDLERNDLGRVCEAGSVKVPQLLQVHSYETVHHLEATIAGKLRDDVTPEDFIRATFPGGSITGAPKKRAMEIIHELEPVARGPYTGSMFYLTPCGHFESNILIRTINIQPNQVSYHVGGGIVADSDPEAEWQETLDKGAALAAALKEFERA